MGPGSRGVPARGIPTPKLPAVRESRAGTPSRSGTPCPCPLCQRVARGRGVPTGRGSQLGGGVGVPARGVLRPVRGQEMREYQEPGTSRKPGPSAFRTLLLHLVM